MKELFNVRPFSILSKWMVVACFRNKEAKIKPGKLESWSVFQFGCES